MRRSGSNGKKSEANESKIRGFDTHPGGRVKSLGGTKKQRGEQSLHSTKLNEHLANTKSPRGMQILSGKYFAFSVSSDLSFTAHGNYRVCTLKCVLDN